MYVTTFYSFKGGVGRTMALVNVAVELARRGRRVLAVDFDLEAPGLDTFNILRTWKTQKRRPGIVDFVKEYLDTGRAPEVERFVLESKDVGKNGGCLSVMPSGEQHHRYATSFREIDWLDLYERHDGYLLFEDLKAQWEQFVKPDYVLIDSRTGHTDTGGICTRQLPDAVAVLFFPNDQNLRGLTTVVRDIRSEARDARKKEIDLHFVMSNVPDLDDEDRILGKKIDAFRRKLGFDGEPLILHRYDSLSLLNQVVFTQDRPGSRLAREYKALVHEIVGRNLADRDGALDYIQHAGERRRLGGATHEMADEIDRGLKRIERDHKGNGDVLFALGSYLHDNHQPDRAEALFHQAIAAGYRDPEAYLKRARLRADSEDRAGASEDALQILGAEDVPHALVLDAARLVSADRAADVAASVAVASMDAGGRIWLAGELKQSADQIAVAVRVLEPVVEDHTLAPGERESARSLLAARYIGVGACEKAAMLLRRGDRDASEMDYQDVFNYGMAMWGQTGEVVTAPFNRFLKLDEEREEREPYPSRRQRMALAYWAVGLPTDASEYLGLAREGLAPYGVSTWAWPGSAFSCWRYRRVSSKEFMKDLDEIEALIDGDTARKPRFVCASAAAQDSSE